MSDCPTCLPADCGLTNDLDLYNLDGPLFPFVLNCPPGFNCNATGEIQVTCGNDFVPVAIPAGSTTEFKVSLIGKALAGCGPKRVFDDPGPDDPGPIAPNGPPVQLYYSRSASCTVYCSEVVTVVNGAPVVTRTGPFTYTFLAGAFIGLTQAAADNAAKALACIRAKQHRFCLSAIQKAFCMGEGFTATIKATGQYISQFPNSDYWEVSAGLPPGLTFHGGFISGGKAVIDGTPTTAGLYTFTVKVTLGSLAAQGDHMEQVYTLAIVDIDTETPLPDLAIGTPYTQNLTLIPSHDQETESWSVVDGALPNGITLTTAGILHGTPTEAGEFPFTAQVTAIVNGTSITCEKDFTFPAMEPFAYWDMDEVSGNRIDLINSLAMVPSIPIGSSPGLISLGAHYPNDANAERRLATAISTDLKYESTGLDISFWVKWSTVATDQLVLYYFLYDIDDNAVDTIFFDFLGFFGPTARVQWHGHQLDVPFTPVLGDWYWLRFFITPSGQAGLQINGGTPALSVDIDPLLPGAKGALAVRQLGSFVGTTSNFVFDELAFFKQVLTAPQASFLYNSGAGRTWPW